MGFVRSITSWLAGSEHSIGYERVTTGFHPFKELDGVYKTTAYDPPSRSLSSGPAEDNVPDFMVSEVDMPGWSSILALYPDLTSDPAFDEVKLGRPRSTLNSVTHNPIAQLIRGSDKNAGMDYLLALIEQENVERCCYTKSDVCVETWLANT